MIYQATGEPWDHDFFIWLKAQVEFSLLDHHSKSNGKNLMGSFEFIFPLYGDTETVHDYRLRQTIH